MTACSQTGELSQQASREELWQAQQAEAGAVQEWNMYARAVLKLEGEAYNIGIRWQRERNGSFMILLEAPFGQGVFRIDYGGAGDYRLLLPDGQSFRNTTAEALLEDAVGWSLPISGLDAWIRGLPHPRSEHSRRLD